MNGIPDSQPTPDPIDLLIVEDEARFLESTRLLLAGTVDRIDVAGSVTEALSLLATREYALALIDLRLPDASGHEIMAFLRAHQPDCRAIVLSGDPRIEAAIQSLRMGAHDYLRKPCEPEEIVKAVRNAARGYRLERDHARMTQRLEQSEHWHRLLVNISPDVIYTLDAEGRFTFLNDSIASTLGFPRDELVGHDYLTIVPPGEAENARHRLNERRTGARATRNFELRLKRRPATGVKTDAASAGTAEEAQAVVELSSLGMYRPGVQGKGEFLGSYGIIRDIGERKRAEATITFQAYHDLLTGLPNRALFKDRLGQAIVQAKRHGQTLATLFLDMDRFKMVNDTLGHLVGDALLQAVGQRLRVCLREGDTLSRIGGDEFMLLLPQIRSRENAAAIADKILSALRQPFHIEGNELYVGMSIGIAIYPDDGEDIETLVKHADIAMYHAKDNGRNNYRFFSSELRNSLTGRLVLENEMRHALDNGEFELYYQPRVDIDSRHIRGMEALVRWNHPTRGLVTPDDFIPIAEECGLIAPIGDWVLDAACGQARRWRDAALPPVTLSINLSPRQIEHPRFAERFGEQVRQYMDDGHGIEIEITENTLMRDTEGAIGKLRKLADMGVEISIDDFGTGYSSLAYLKKLPVNTIKIDRAFIRDLDQPAGSGGEPAKAGSGPIVAGITAMAKGLDLGVVAEGVETRGQLDRISALGCDAYQGFLYSRAVDAEQATRMLDRQIH